MSKHHVVFLKAWMVVVLDMAVVEGRLVVEGAVMVEYKDYHVVEGRLVVEGAVVVEDNHLGCRVASPQVESFEATQVYLESLGLCHGILVKLAMVQDPMDLAPSAVNHDVLPVHRTCDSPATLVKAWAVVLLDMAVYSILVYHLWLLEEGAGVL